MVRIHAAALPWAWVQISSWGNGVLAVSDTMALLSLSSHVSWRGVCFNIASRRAQRHHPNERFLWPFLTFVSGSLDGIVGLFTRMRGETVRKGYERCFERGSGRYEEGEIGRKEPSRRSVGLRHRRPRGFSDSFSTHSG